MKSIMLLLALLSAASSVQTLATPVTRQQAQLNALAFLQERGKSIAMSSLRHAPMRAAQADEQQPFYVFNIGDNQGYVIASGDDAAHAVLGYSDEGFIDVNDMPCSLQAWLDGYAYQIEYLQEHGATAYRSPKKIITHPAVAPLLTCCWGQGSCFNMYCPTDPTDGRQCPTGCVATAMAQVMYYYRDKSVDRTVYEIPAYTTESRQIHIEAIPAGTVIDWDNMIDSYRSGNPTEEQKAAVANLMKLCGASTFMNYRSGGSGSTNVLAKDALSVYFNYSNKSSYIQRSYYISETEEGSYYSDEEWDQIIYNELAENRPVFYSGLDPKSKTAHSFVCDGYDGNGYYHFNWGWNTSGGYCLLDAYDAVDPQLMYVSQQGAVIGIQPRTYLPDTAMGMSFVDPIAKYECLTRWDENDDGVFTLNEAQSVTNIGPNEFSYSLMSSFDEFKDFENVTNIDWCAFFRCRNLKNITMPNSVKTIGGKVFWECPGLTSLTIPVAVTAIDQEPFLDCDNLKEIIWNAKNCEYTYYRNLKTIECLTFGDSVEVIPNQIAIYCDGLKSVTISNSVKTIGQFSFYGCAGLKRVVIPNTVTSIEASAFRNCNSLVTVVLPNSVISTGSIDAHAFADCSNLKNVICLSTNPVSDVISQSVFQGSYETAILRVPIEAIEIYKSTWPWSKFTNMVGLDPSLGDVNLDGVVNITDINGVISCILASGNDSLTDFMSDINRDGSINIADINAVISMILQ